MAGCFLPLDVFPFKKRQEVVKGHSPCVQTMGGGIPDEGGLGYSAIHKKEINRSDSDSESADSTPCSGRAGL
jgi:hypothetical protein